MPLQQSLGSQIRKRREEAGLSLRALAQQASISASFLSQVERGQVSPSLNSLHAIAEALKVPLFYFLLDDASAEHLVRNGQGAQLRLPGTDLDYELRSPTPHRKILSFVGRIKPGYTHKAIPPKGSTQETIYVLEGGLRLELADGVHTLDVGDSITFDGLNLRRLSAHGELEAAYLSFISPPAF